MRKSVNGVDMFENKRIFIFAKITDKVKTIIPDA